MDVDDLKKYLIKAVEQGNLIKVDPRAEAKLLVEGEGSRVESSDFIEIMVELPFGKWNEIIEGMEGS